MAVVQFNLFFACLATLCLLVHSTHTADVRYCNKKASYDVKVSGVEISPYPVARGKNTTFSIAASTDKVLSGGKMVIDVSYFFLHVYQETDDLCAKTPCPVSSGDFVISHSQVLPGITPPGSYTLQMTITDEKHEMTCINFDFSIGLGASEAVADV